MWTLLAFSCVLLIVLVLIDGFEAILLPRRVTRTFRFARVFFVVGWRVWATLARRIAPGWRREAFLSNFGPLSIVVLFGLWALGLIIGFAVLHQALGTPLNRTGGESHPFDYAYMSGVIFFTLGFGDVTPITTLGRALAVIEAGIGFGFLAAVIGYLPVLYGAFSKRELTISLLDARAGSPPTAAQVLLRAAPHGQLAALDSLLREWERWSAELLESHLSFPVLTYYRSQHDNQSWLAALTTILDTCALLLARVPGFDSYQAQLTFAMARHAAVDLSQIYGAQPRRSEPERITAEGLHTLDTALQTAGIEVRTGEAADRALAELRAIYEPFVHALASHFLLTIPPIATEGVVVDNWQRSAWMQRPAGIGKLSFEPIFDGHQED
jgi:hypothetical protein